MHAVMGMAHQVVGKAEKSIAMPLACQKSTLHQQHQTALEWYTLKPVLAH